MGSTSIGPVLAVCKVWPVSMYKGRDPVTDLWALLPELLPTITSPPAEDPPRCRGQSGKATKNRVAYLYNKLGITHSNGRVTDVEGRV